MFTIVCGIPDTEPPVALGGPPAPPLPTEWGTSCGVVEWAC